MCSKSVEGIRCLLGMVSRGLVWAWCRIAGADIKDKQPLMDARKSIERDMERFKACEKEAKMKGGIGGGKNNDPKEKAKEDARDWINNTVDSLTGKVAGWGCGRAHHTACTP